MSRADWIVLSTTLAGIIMYGIYKSRTKSNLDGYFLADRQMPWWLVLLSIMGTQASAITFLSLPGLAYTDGMRFVQFYFGLPLAMIVISASFVPIFHKLKVYTAYEFLQQRFDLKTRTFTSFLFLLSRGISTGASIYAPAIIMSSLMGWNIYWTNIFMGGLLIIYTVTGGAKAVAYTQQLQLIIVFVGMFLAAYIVVHQLPEGVGFIDALKVGGAMGKMNVITTGAHNGKYDWDDRYNLINGIVAGFFLQLSYFGTDQSQVGRYLTAKSLKGSRIGLLMNGLVKIPMQFAILLVGVLVFSFYQFHPTPLFFNESQLTKAKQGPMGDSLRSIEATYNGLNKERSAAATAYLQSDGKNAAVVENWKSIDRRGDTLRAVTKKLIRQTDRGADTNDTNYIFLRFVVDNLPKGLVGLLVAMIFLASWGSIAAALNALASTTVVDIHKQFIQKNLSEAQDYRVSKWYTLGWGLFSIVIAQFASNLGSLIEAVNILSAPFYGVILGIFLVAFYVKSVKGNALFYGAVVVELIILLMFWKSSIGYIWLSAIGALGVIVLSWLFQNLTQRRKAL